MSYSELEAGLCKPHTKWDCCCHWDKGYSDILLPAIILVQCWLLANRCESPQHDCCMWLCTKLDIIGHQASICSLLGTKSQIQLLGLLQGSSAAVGFRTALNLFPIDGRKAEFPYHACSGWIGQVPPLLTGALNLWGGRTCPRAALLTGHFTCSYVAL